MFGYEQDKVKRSLRLKMTTVPSSGDNDVLKDFPKGYKVFLFNCPLNIPSFVSDSVFTLT